nr:stalk domain-containing protein [Paenibacillus oenotherae]
MEGSTLVPFRAIFESLGAKVAWDPETGTVTGSKNGLAIKLIAGSTKAAVNNKAYSLSAPSVIKNGSMMVPLRFISENFDMYVSWNAKERRIGISSDPAIDGRTKRMIRAMSSHYAANGKAKPFLTEPRVTGTYAAGELTATFHGNGLKAANYMRYLAGLPDDLISDEALIRQAQHGAVLLASTDLLTHTPSQPADMSDAFFNAGYKSTTSSNIYARYGGSASPDFLAETVKGYMDDEDSSNVSRVGHRRWILNPALQRIGFGFAMTEDNNHYYSSMQVFDTSRKDKVEYTEVLWPNRGYFPTETFAGNVPWSVSLNPLLYEEPDGDSITVTLERRSDQKVWKLDRKSDNPDNARYFHVDTGGYGIPNAIIFRPDGIQRYQDGDIYDVSISGLVNKQGGAATLRYSVHFFD